MINTEETEEDLDKYGRRRPLSSSMYMKKSTDYS